MAAKAYIEDPIKVSGGYVARVVDDQDYHERGPHAHSHETDVHKTKELATAAAKGWAEKHGFTITSADEVARG